MTAITQTVFDLSEGDDEFVTNMLELLGRIPPSEDGMKAERILSEIRTQWAAPFAEIIEERCRIAAKIHVCSTLEEPEDPDRLLEEIDELASVFQGVVTSIFGAIAQAEFQRGHSNCQTSG